VILEVFYLSVEYHMFGILKR